MLKMNRTALRNQIEQRSMVEFFELSKDHRLPAMLNPKSEIRNLIDPLVALRNEDGQLFHHVLSLSDCADHAHTRSGEPFLRHFLTGMTAPALRVGMASKNVPIDFRKLAIMQPRFTSAINVVAVIEHETCPVGVAEIFKADDLHLVSRLAVV